MGNRKNLMKAVKFFKPDMVHKELYQGEIDRQYERLPRFSFIPKNGDKPYQSYSRKTLDELRILHPDCLVTSN